MVKRFGRNERAVGERNSALSFDAVFLVEVPEELRDSTSPLLIKTCGALGSPSLTAKTIL